ncbi:MAG: hypothetical protein L0Y60_04225 [Beijerinckiaceae bacterium]|nr:hypothetical protein [Beijerinckiaceae bacterium]
MDETDNPNNRSEPDRQLTGPERARREIADREKQAVLAQPHRRGRFSPLRESVLGCFVEDHDCGSECYEAGWRYMVLTYRWRMAAGISVPVWVREEFGGKGTGLDGEALRDFGATVAAWRKEIDGCRAALQATGPMSRGIVEAMLFDRLYPVPLHIAEAKQGLVALAKFLRKLR